MARIAFKCTLGQSLGNGAFNTQAGASTPLLTSATAADDAAGTASGTLADDVAAAVGVLVADGASPTEAHVTTLNTAWGLLATAIAAAKTATAAAKVAADGPDVIVEIDDAVVTTQNGARASLLAVLHTIRGSGMAP